MMHRTFLWCALFLLSYLPAGLAHTNSNNAKPEAQSTSAQRDGSHDFDPLLGKWKYHLKRRLHPLTGSNQWVEFDGTGVCRKIWEGAMLEQAIFNAPSDRIEGLVVRLYNPQSHQWSLSWANRKTGTFDPPQIGEFKNGVGEFFAQDRIDGKVVLVRFRWTNLNTSTPHFEQSFSNDGGTTWEVNWITDQTRVDDLPDKEQ
jgi:hypothetical protein